MGILKYRELSNDVVEPTEKLDAAAVPDQERGFRVRLLEERDTESARDIIKRHHFNDRVP
ncbi:hypothetical protein IB265_19835 [Ensifer sp. ENS10]|uniref:hypothetical protein n=1 Tax=Ensifer sp. ENS10 TaxID=2769286 RepID=UPI00177AB38F|nr:hypothetical protein [Ensifer sp. ENS10]MBD9509026.1 hypothetical protein [Ensifer sp. ENS10]